MRDRLSDWQPAATLQPGGESVISKPNAVQDAVSALTALGYKPPEASRLVGQVDSDGLASEMIIKAALKISVT